MKRLIKCFMIITAIFGLLALSSCDTNGTASAPTARSANDALRAIPLISEVLGVGENGTQSVSAAGWMGVLGEGEEEEECEKHEDLCSIEDEIQQLLNTEFLLSLIRAIAGNEDISLAMNVDNRIGVRDRGFLPPEPGSEDSDDECVVPPDADFGIVRVTETADWVRIQWVLPGQNDTEKPFDSCYGWAWYLDVKLDGWPIDITKATFWMVIDDPSTHKLSYEYGELFLKDRRALVHRELAERMVDDTEDAPYVEQGAKTERMVFRAINGGYASPGGGMEGISLVDEALPHEQKKIFSFRDIPGSHTAVATTPLPAETSTSTLRLFRAGNDATPVIEETTGGGVGGTLLTVHGQNRMFFRNAEYDEANPTDEANFVTFLTRSTALFNELDGFEMPTNKPGKQDFPALPPLP